ncbi:hypothetical protein P691DRAFT_803922 [Macrolepiota fuliginosa MF-IS2]|uniref:F-box domain-containing protein n=1 Tax=Macrolepiota fuliginosa MF-IS2 TaxID=1400762 RepID=A0A9P5X8H9_9AGAR|nr:hypothetical protein P691DRAFT_803922 [Macrolepiota fuliginosa MF-IS2]
MAGMDTESKQCLLCGSAQTTKFAFNSNLSPEGEVCRLYHELCDPDIIADVIPVQRVYMLRRINHSRALTARLPAEILDEIFIHAWLSAKGSRDHDNNHFQVVLASVSSHWRELVFSNPIFWASLSLDFCEHGGRQLLNRLGMLRLYLTHSGSAPLDFRFRFSAASDGQLWPTFDTLVHPDIDNLLLANLHRIRDLYLETASPKWAVSTPRLSQIRTFNYSCNIIPFHSTFISFPNTQHLRELIVLGWPYIETKSGPWTSLTILTLESIEVNVCVCLLAGCTNLVEFRCREPKTLTVSSWLSYPPWTTRVTRDSLEVFEWQMPRSGHPGRVEIALLQYLHCPALKYLKLHAYHHRQHPAVQLFCKRLPTTLLTLNLSAFCDDEELRDRCLFNSFPRDCQVEELIISCNGCEMLIGHAFSWLEDPTYFPRLNRIIVDDISRTKERCNKPRILSPSWQGLMLHRMLAQRLPVLKHSGFDMLLDSIDVGWSWEVKHTIWSLGQDHEFSLRIFHNPPIHRPGAPLFS